jgi:hypothetical protein
MESPTLTLENATMVKPATRITLLVIFMAIPLHDYLTAFIILPIFRERKT